jgi:hypothetical protein
MSNYGFVYLLGNPAMPCYYKIGCTERSPHRRAEELSNATCVPQPFQVLLYIEVDDFQKVESRLHIELADFRVNSGREFFCFGPAHMGWLRDVFRAHPYRTAYTECEWYEFAPHVDEVVDAWTNDGEYLRMPSHPPIKRGGLRLVA